MKDRICQLWFTSIKNGHRFRYIRRRSGKQSILNEDVLKETKQLNPCKITRETFTCLTLHEHHDRFIEKYQRETFGCSWTFAWELYTKFQILQKYINQECWLQFCIEFLQEIEYLFYMPTKIDKETYISKWEINTNAQNRYAIHRLLISYPVKYEWWRPLRSIGTWKEHLPHMLHYVKNFLLW